jgi:hypothetical protein
LTSLISFDNRALSFLDISNNDIGKMVLPSGWKDTSKFNFGKDDWELDTRYQHTDGTKQRNEPHNKPEGAIAIANAIKDMRAMSSLHVGCNQIPEKEMRKIMAIAMSKESMKVLCEVPIKDKTITALDVSGKMLGVEGALVVAEYLDGNEALTSLNISSNNIGELVLPAGWSEYGEGWKDPQGSYRSTSKGPPPGSKPEGIIALADGIKNNGALAKLDMSSNNIGPQQEEDLQRICMAGGIELTK